MTTKHETESHNLEDIYALVQTGHRELVPIFSVQVLQKYEQQTFKGLDLATQQELQKDSEGNREIKPIQPGKTGIASRYE